MCVSNLCPTRAVKLRSCDSGMILVEGIEQGGPCALAEGRQRSTEKTITTGVKEQSGQGRWPQEHAQTKGQHPVRSRPFKHLTLPCFPIHSDRLCQGSSLSLTACDLLTAGALVASAVDVGARNGFARLNA
jgi:hypothetical protein